MLEKLARIIGEHYDGYVDPINTPNRWPVAEGCARAVIEALMSPTVAQRIAGAHAADIRPSEAEWVYVAMLKSILQSKEEGEGR